MTGIHIANYENNAEEEIPIVVEILLKATAECLCFVACINARNAPQISVFAFLCQRTDLATISLQSCKYSFENTR